MRVPSGEPELVRAGAEGDPAALAALWDAYGARVFAFCQRVLGRADGATPGFTGPAPRRPAARPKRRPASRPLASVPAPASPAPAPVAPAPVTADAPADESPVQSSTADAPATTAQVPAAATAPATTAPHAPTPSIPVAQPATSDQGRWSGPDTDEDDGGRPWGAQDHGGGWHQAHRPCPSAPRGPRRARGTERAPWRPDAA